VHRSLSLTLHRIRDTRPSLCQRPRDTGSDLKSIDL
jgi:hypothetical protein